MNRVTRFLFALWIVASGSIGSPQPCAAATMVTLRGATEVRGAAVRLSDVFSGIPAEKDHEIAQAPAPGKQVTYDVHVLGRLAKKYQLDWQPGSTADHAIITAASTHITGDMIREVLLVKTKSLTKGDVDIIFDNRALDIHLPAGSSSEFTLNNLDYNPLSKHFRADFSSTTASGPFSMPITGKISVKRSVPVLARRLESGTIIGSSDIDWISVPEEHVNNTVITDAEQLIGRELRRTANNGEIFHLQDVIPPRLVTRGSLVTLKIETPLMLLTAQGKAMQDGTRGEVVRVTNTQSNRVIEGIVEGPGTVRVQSLQKVAAAQ